MAELTVNVKMGDTPPLPLQVKTSDTVGELKSKIADAFPGKDIKLMVYMGKVLNNDAHTLESCKLQDGSTILVRAVPSTAAGAALAAAANAPAPSASSSSSSSSAATRLAAAAPPSARMPGSSALAPSGSQTSSARAAIAAVRAANSPEVARECLATVLKMVDKVVEQPLEEKFRKIKKSNAAFKRKVGDVPGSSGLLAAVGFSETAEDGGTWALTPTPSAWEVLQAGRRELQAATAAGGGGSGSSGGGGGAASGFGGGFGGYGTGAPPQMGPAEMAAMQQLASNPAMMQQAMADPRVQNMLRSNPQAAQAMQMLQQNPAMMQQFMQQAQAGNVPGMRGGSGGGGFNNSYGSYGAPAGQPPPPRLPPASGPAVGTPQLPFNLLPPHMLNSAGAGSAPPAVGDEGAAGGDDELTEEQLIAEAIARSLHEM